jgi:methylmalonyl-CoA mutase N-terminal domain/subunit
MLQMMIAVSERARHPSRGLAAKLHNDILNVRVQHQRCVNPGRPSVIITCDGITFITGTAIDPPNVREKYVTGKISH